jgi:hypothetical protein
MTKKCKVFAEGELSTPKKIAAGVPQGLVLAPVLNCLRGTWNSSCCSRMIPVFTEQRNTNVVFSANYIMGYLQ